MSKEQLKKELHELIDKIEDEELLHVVKEDIVAYQSPPEAFDDLSDLTDEQRAELEEAANEEPEKDAISYEEFKSHMNAYLKTIL